MCVGSEEGQTPWGSSGRWEVLTQRAQEVFSLEHLCPLTCKARSPAPRPSNGLVWEWSPCSGYSLSQTLGFAQARSRRPPAPVRTLFVIVWLRALAHLASL